MADPDEEMLALIEAGTCTQEEKRAMEDSWKAKLARHDELEPLVELAGKLGQHRYDRDRKLRGAVALIRLRAARQRLLNDLNIEATHCIIGWLAMDGIMALMSLDAAATTIDGLRVLRTDSDYHGIDVGDDFVGVTWNA